MLAIFSTRARVGFVYIFFPWLRADDTNKTNPGGEEEEEKVLLFLKS